MEKSLILLSCLLEGEGSARPSTPSPWVKNGCIQDLCMRRGEDQFLWHYLQSNEAIVDAVSM